MKMKTAIYCCIIAIPLLVVLYAYQSGSLGKSEIVLTKMGVPLAGHTCTFVMNTSNQYVSDDAGVIRLKKEDKGQQVYVAVTRGTNSVAALILTTLKHGRLRLDFDENNVPAGITTETSPFLKVNSHYQYPTNSEFQGGSK